MQSLLLQGKKEGGVYCKINQEAFQKTNDFLNNFLIK